LERRGAARTFKRHSRPYWLGTFTVDGVLEAGKPQAGMVTVEAEAFAGRERTPYTEACSTASAR
jgi:hypothetical protein